MSEFWHYLICPARIWPEPELLPALGNHIKRGSEDEDDDGYPLRTHGDNNLQIQKMGLCYWIMWTKRPSSKIETQKMKILWIFIFGWQENLITMKGGYI